MMRMIEQGTLYGSGRVEVTATISTGGLHLRQDSTDHDHHMYIHVGTLEGIERLETLLEQAKVQLRSAEERVTARDEVPQALLV